jgi:quercetin dioxygenase-like cupin family protein
MSRFHMRVPLRRALLLAGSVGCLTIGAAAASATPPAGVAGAPILSRGTVTQDVVIGSPVRKTVTRKVTVRVRGRKITKRVKVKVNAVRTLIRCSAAQPCDMAVQQVTINPGGYTGWHTHPGATFVTVAQGEGTLYHAGPAGAGCNPEKYPTGSGFFQSFEDVHTLQNEGTVPLVVQALYVLPPGTPNTAIRTDQAQPANCPNIP